MSTEKTLSIIKPDAVSKNIIGKIISRFESLKKIHTEKIHPTAHVTNLENSLREDISEKGIDTDDILSNAPEINSGEIKIPRVFENE